MGAVCLNKVKKHALTPKRARGLAASSGACREQACGLMSHRLYFYFNEIGFRNRIFGPLV